MNIAIKELEERYKVIKINKISDDVEVVDLYRAENDTTYHIRLIFAFNKLFTSGDCGSFTFGKSICHIYDFFKGDNVNLGYWQEKVEASPRPLLCEDIDTDKAFDLVKKYFEENEIEYDEDDLYYIGESNMYRAYDELTELFEKYDDSDPYEEASNIVDECRDWDGQFEYTCNVIQWVENNLDEWRMKYETRN